METPDLNDSCDDTLFCKFELLDGSGKMERCNWLNKQDELIKQDYCEISETVRELCPESCGLCQDTCEDSDGQKVDVDGVMRTCKWLRDRPSKKASVCVETHEAWTTCPEFCGNCKGKNT
jgi:hypothetical protein